MMHFDVEFQIATSRAKESTIFHIHLPSHAIVFIPSFYWHHYQEHLCRNYPPGPASSMHLLEIKGDDNFSLITFVGSKIPSYAILSHTWEADNQELTFQDVKN